MRNTPDLREARKATLGGQAGASVVQTSGWRDMLVRFEEAPRRLTRHHGVTFGLTPLGLVSSCSVRVRPTHC